LGLVVVILERPFSDVSKNLDFEDSGEGSFRMTIGEILKTHDKVLSE